MKGPSSSTTDWLSNLLFSTAIAIGLCIAQGAVPVSSSLYAAPAMASVKRTQRDDTLFDIPPIPLDRLTHRNDALFPQTHKNVDRTTMETVQQTAVLTTLTAILKMANLEQELDGSGPYTVVMPWNHAFEALPIELMDKLLQPEWILHLRDILLYHVYLGDMPFDLSQGPNVRVLTMANGEEADFLVENQRIFVNTAFNIAYTQPSNGFAYMADQVLLPSFVFHTIVDVLSTPSSLSVSSASMSTLASLIVLAGFEEALSNVEAELTIFAPTNEAFAALDPAVLEFLQSPDGLQSLQSTLRYHFVGGVYSSAANGLDQGRNEITSLLGDPLVIVKDESDNLSVNGVAVSSPDNLANNGIIHIIPRVLSVSGVQLPPATPTAQLPPTGPPVPAAATTTAPTPIVMAMPTMGPVTLIPTTAMTRAAPTPIVMALPTTAPISVPAAPTPVVMALPTTAPISMPNVVPTLEQSSVPASLSIPTVAITPNASSFPTATESATSATAAPAFVEQLTLAQLVENTPTLSTLYDAMVAVGMVETMNSTGPFVLFAPTNEAFAKFPFMDEYRYLTDPAWILHLTELLKFHVAERDLESTADFTNEMMIPMLNGENVMLTIVEGQDTEDQTVHITPAVTGSATILGSDMEPSNGELFQVSNVLLPSFFSSNLFDLAESSSMTLTALLITAELDRLLDSTLGLTVFVPTDEAFEKLGPDEFTRLLSPEGKDDLIELLSYHVTKTVLPSVALPSDGSYATITSLQGLDLRIAMTDDGTVVVNDFATVTGADILAHNGIVHLIDTVLTLPQTRGR